MTIDTTSVSAGFASVGDQITGAIKQAASATGASFEYLLSAAKIESNMNPTAGASTSSARGLYQFIEQTWLGTVKEAGPSLGYGQYADAISKSSSGTYSVSDPATRNAILKLRDDPAVNAAMAGVLTQSNSFKLTADIGRRPTDGELYIAHFMGVNGASKLINSAQDNPNANAAQMFPGAASANRPIFYDKSGNARSVSEVYSVLTSRYDAAANSSSTRAALASLGSGNLSATPAVASAVTPAAAVTAAATTQADAFFLSSFPQMQQAPAATPASQQAASQQVAAATSTAQSQQNQAAAVQPTFRSLFQAGERSDPISTTVRELWGNNSSLSSNIAGQGQGQNQAANQPRPLDLFSDRSGTFSG